MILLQKLSILCLEVLVKSARTAFLPQIPQESHHARLLVRIELQYGRISCVFRSRVHSRAQVRRPAQRCAADVSAAHRRNQRARARDNTHRARAQIQEENEKRDVAKRPRPS